VTVVIPPDTGARPPGFVPQSSLAGSVGLLHMGTAEVGGPMQFRLGLHGEFLSTQDFLLHGTATTGGDRNARTQGAVTFGATLGENVEVFGAILASANRNRRRCAASALTGEEVCVAEAGRTDPEIIKTYGDLILGAKVAQPVTPALSLGGEFGIRLMSSFAGVSFSPSATSLWVNALALYDLKQVTNNVPIRFHASLGYYVDNSRNLVEYTDVDTATSRIVSRFAYGISSSRFRLALGVDAPLYDLLAGISVRPILEYHFEALRGEADPVVAASCAPACGMDRTQRWLTLGIQGQTQHGLTFTVGLDFASKSVDQPYGPPLPPWNLLLGVGYPMELVPRIITHHVPVEKIVTKDAPLREGWVAGKVLTATETPVDGAIIGIAGRALSRVVSDADGSFRSPLLPPGPVELAVTAVGFENATVPVKVVAGQAASITVHLTARPPSAWLTGRIVDELGRGLAVGFRLTGPQVVNTRSDQTGKFAADVTVGTYALRAEGEQFLAKEVHLTVTEGQENTTTVTLRTRPSIPGVVLQEQEKQGHFEFRQPLTFRSVAGKPSAQLAAGTLRLLDEVVDIFFAHPEIHQLRVEATWDRSLPAEKAQSLTAEQAMAVAKYLADQGVPAERIVAVGAGQSMSKGGNIGPRRVELTAINW
jgi:outer membrane protein OmpA-like peptidoglycan-associated protein